MSDQYAPVWKELALPSEEERRMYEEWVRQQEEKEREEKKQEQQSKAGDREVVGLDYSFLDWE